MSALTPIRFSTFDPKSLAEVEGHLDDPAVQLAFEDLSHYSEWVKVLGTYPAHPFRKTA